MARPQLPTDQISKAGVRKRAQRAISLRGKSCAECGSTESLERHHPDYGKPEAVVILCNPHHRERDQTDGTAIHRVPLATCTICGESYQPRKRRNSTLCTKPECLKELGKRSAAKRWRTGLTDSERAVTA